MADVEPIENSKSDKMLIYPELLAKELLQKFNGWTFTNERSVARYVCVVAQEPPDSKNTLDMYSELITLAKEGNHDEFKTKWDKIQPICSDKDFAKRCVTYYSTKNEVNRKAVANYKFPTDDHAYTQITRLINTRDQYGFPQGINIKSPTAFSRYISMLYTDHTSTAASIDRADPMVVPLVVRATTGTVTDAATNMVVENYVRTTASYASVESNAIQAILTVFNERKRAIAQQQKHKNCLAFVLTNRQKYEDLVRNRNIRYLFERTLSGASKNAGMVAAMSSLMKHEYILSITWGAVPTSFKDKESKITTQHEKLNCIMQILFQA